MIYRPDYIEAVKPFINQPIVKILSGVRRCGKSTIFDRIHDELLKEGVKEEDIIRKRYTEMDIPSDITAKQRYDDLLERRNGRKHCYLLLDEVQEVPNWEKAVNSLLEGSNADIYVTGSNSKLRSSEISTYLTGRYVQIPVYTLSFREFLEFKKNSALSTDEKLEEYMRFGGFPIIALGNYNPDSAYQISNGIYHTIASRDIISRHRRNRQDLFERVVRFTIENIGKTFSANSIAAFRKNEHRSISVESIYNYLKWLEQAFIIYPCPRYDLKGKNILKTQEKYYLSDISLKYALFGYNPSMLDSILENIIFLELKRRGYNVYVGKDGDKEIDFLAEHGNDRIYVQACVRLPENSNREVSNLMNVQDHYPKYVVTLDRFAGGNINGIKIVYLSDFLLAERW